MEPLQLPTDDEIRTAYDQGKEAVVGLIHRTVGQLAARVQALKDRVSSGVKKRQVFDLLPLKVEVTEHQVEASAVPLQPLAVQANRNLVVDPQGRVVDVTFDRDLTVTAPWDRFRFGIDVVQPMARDAGAFLGDLTGDGVPDLIMADSKYSFFPGQAGQPRRFGEGTYLKNDWPLNGNPFYLYSDWWNTGTVGDLDGDGQEEIVLGAVIYRNVGTPSEPRLQEVGEVHSAWNTPPSLIDPSPSVGDLNGDGKLDVVISNTWPGGNYIFWNHSTPGSFSFSKEFLFESIELSFVTLGDLNGDGLLDLAAPEGIYFNSGTAQAPSFDFEHPMAWNKSGGPSWQNPSSQQPTHIFLIDVDNNDTLDAYVSNTSYTLWQVLFYRNLGTPAAHQFQYEGPVVATSAPLNITYRGYNEPCVVGCGNRAYVANGDVDQNGLPEILLSPATYQSNRSTLLWSFLPVSGSATAPLYSYQDLYTYPEMPQITPNCGATYGEPDDPLCHGRAIFAAWADLTGDGLPDELRSTGIYDNFYLKIRSGTWPFSLGEDNEIRTSPSNELATAWGIVLLDVDLDGGQDVVTGSQDGKLLYYRNLATDGTLALADPLILSDNGVEIDVGNQAWPTAIDLDGDSDLDFLVANEDGKIRQVLNILPGSSQGYTPGELLGTLEQAQLDIWDCAGSDCSPSLTTLDVDKDGLQDIVVGDELGKVWWLRNVGSSTAPIFSLRPFNVTRTAAAYMEVIGARSVRLYFALPTVPGETVLSYDGIPTDGSPLSGEVLISPDLTPPGALSKSDPTNGAISQPTNPTLSWGASSGANSYEYCYDTTNDGVCDGSWISTGTNTSIALSGLDNNTTYYWQVQSVNAGGTTYADGGTWWSFTVAPENLFFYLHLPIILK